LPKAFWKLPKGSSSWKKNEKVSQKLEDPSRSFQRVLQVGRRMRKLAKSLRILLEASKGFFESEEEASQKLEDPSRSFQRVLRVGRRS
jgi:hypothetical protein